MMVILMVFLLIYTGFIILLIYPFFFEKPNAKPLTEGVLTKFSIIIVFKDEYTSLNKLLLAINKINYDLNCFEVILIEDNTQQMLILPKVDFSIHYQLLVEMHKAPKKMGITQAIKLAQHPWVVVTDADVMIGADWLRQFHDKIMQFPEKRMWCAPVFINSGNKFINHYQQWDFLSLQGATLSSFYYQKPLMCNGANMCYQKSLFAALNGFNDCLHTPTGDDVFLMFKAHSKNPRWVGYIKTFEGSVSTLGLTAWRAVVNQRVRWSSKIKLYNNLSPKLVGMLLFVGHVIVLFCFFAFCFALRWYCLFWLIYKLFIDYIYLKIVANYWQKKPSYLILSLMIHPFVQLMIILRSLLGFDEWKGRIYKT